MSQLLSDLSCMFDFTETTTHTKVRVWRFLRDARCRTRSSTELVLEHWSVSGGTRNGDCCCNCKPFHIVKHDTVQEAFSETNQFVEAGICGCSMCNCQTEHR